MSIKLGNIDNVLVFQKNKNDNKNDTVMSLEQLESRYGFEPDGTNIYVGLNKQNVTDYKKSRNALNVTDRELVTTFLDSLKASHLTEKTLIIGVEPSQLQLPYQYVLGVCRGFAARSAYNMMQFRREWAFSSERSRNPHAYVAEFAGLVTCESSRTINCRNGGAPRSARH